MKNLAELFLSQPEQEKITAAVKAVERITSGEIVPMIVSQSHDYPRARLVASFFYSLPLTSAATHLLADFFWLNPLNVYFFFLLLVPIFLVSHAIVSAFPQLYKLFIARAEMAVEVEEEAMKSFYSEKLYETKQNNGILLFISVFEKKAWILADHGINEIIDSGRWQSIVDRLTVEIGRDNRCEGICDAVKSIGDILVNHFPYQRDDTDELHNLIIR